MEPSEQFQVFPDVKGLRPYAAQPVWLVLSIALRERGYDFANSLRATGQMENMRRAVEAKHGQHRIP